MLHGKFSTHKRLFLFYITLSVSDLSSLKMAWKLNLISATSWSLFQIYEILDNKTLNMRQCIQAVPSDQLAGAEGYYDRRPEIEFRCEQRGKILTFPELKSARIPILFMFFLFTFYLFPFIFNHSWL